MFPTYETEICINLKFSYGYSNGNYGPVCPTYVRKSKSASYFYLKVFIRFCKMYGEKELSDQLKVKNKQLEFTRELHINLLIKLTNFILRETFFNII